MTDFEKFGSIIRLQTHIHTQIFFHSIATLTFVVYPRLNLEEFIDWLTPRNNRFLFSNLNLKQISSSSSSWYNHTISIATRISHHCTMWKVNELNKRTQCKVYRMSYFLVSKEQMKQTTRNKKIITTNERKFEKWHFSIFGVSDTKQNILTLFLYLMKSKLL